MFVQLNQNKSNVLTELNIVIEDIMMRGTSV